MADLPFERAKRPTRVPVARTDTGWFEQVRRARRAEPAGRLAVGRLDVQAVERDRLGELGADLVAGGPFDHGIGAVAAGQHQPHARTDLEMDVRDGHEAALGNVDDLRLDAAGAELAHSRVDLDR